jgi:hypothetical protein
MPRLIFSNPFKKHDASEFPDVVIPLEQAVRQPSVKSNEKHDDASRASSDGVQTGGARTLESLRAEVDSDIAAGGEDTAYDRKSKVINKALADMGMGRYQWSLFVLCGFGWLADKYVFSFRETIFGTALTRTLQPLASRCCTDSAFNVRGVRC